MISQLTKGNIKKCMPLLLLVLMAVLAFNSPAPGGVVKGTVSPPEAGLHAFLFAAKDTVSVNVVNGNFQFTKIAAGSYVLMIEGVPPYRNTIKDGIQVTEGGVTDAGQLEMHK